MNDNLITPSFQRKHLEQSKAPLAVKLNDKDEELIKIGRYAYNMESKSGVLKFLAHKGLKVLLAQDGVEEMHKLTRADRRRLVQEKPDYIHFEKKV